MNQQETYKLVIQGFIASWIQLHIDRPSITGTQIFADLVNNTKENFHLLIHDLTNAFDDLEEVYGIEQELYDSIWNMFIEMYKPQGEDMFTCQWTFTECHPKRIESAEKIKLIKMGQRVFDSEVISNQRSGKS